MGVELARELPADVLHLAPAYGLFENVHDGTGVGLRRSDLHDLFLSDALEEVVEREDKAAVRRLPVQKLGQPLRELGGEIVPFAPGQVLPERGGVARVAASALSNDPSPACCWTRPMNSWYCTYLPSPKSSGPYALRARPNRRKTGATMCGVL